jgi:hypothetical protein
VRVHVIQVRLRRHLRADTEDVILHRLRKLRGSTDACVQLMAGPTEGGKNSVRPSG